MKQKISGILFMLITFVITCFGQQPLPENKQAIVKISVDTLFLNLKPYFRQASLVGLQHIVKFHNKFYCIFYETYILGGGSINDDNFGLLVSSQGIVEKRFELPNAIKKKHYMDFFVYQDKIYLKDYYRPYRTYELQISDLHWIQREEVDDIVYEDEDYKTCYLDFGEWGENLWFIDKKNKQYISPNNFKKKPNSMLEPENTKFVRDTYSLYEYVTSGGSSVNKWNGSYYITSSHAVLKIANPRQLVQCTEETSYYTKRKEQEHMAVYDIKMGEIIFWDSSYRRFGYPKFFIITSFISKNQLFHIYYNKGNYYIGKVENQKMCPIQKIDYEVYSPLDKYCYRGKIQNNMQLFRFPPKQVNTFGIIELDSSEMKVHFWKHNTDSLPHAGKIKAMQRFNTLFDTIIEHLEHLPLAKIQTLENLLGGTNTGRYQTWSDNNKIYPNKDLAHQESAITYIQVQDTFITNETNYYYTFNQQDTLVKAIFLSWSDTQPYYTPSGNRTWSYNSLKKANKILPDIIKFISSRLGTPKKENKGDLTWVSKSGITVHLWRRPNSDMEIRITIKSK
jgi:hypothetical protein